MRTPYSIFAGALLLIGGITLGFAVGEQAQREKDDSWIKAERREHVEIVGKLQSELAFSKWQYSVLDTLSGALVAVEKSEETCDLAELKRLRRDRAIMLPYHSQGRVAIVEFREP